MHDDPGVYDAGAATPSARGWCVAQTVWASDAAPSAFGAVRPRPIVCDHARDDTHAGYSSGAAYVFDAGTRWIQVAKLIANDAAVFDNFGQSAALVDDVAICPVGSDGPRNQVPRIFSSDSAGHGSRLLYASDAGNGDFFGQPSTDRFQSAPADTITSAATRARSTSSNVKLASGRRCRSSRGGRGRSGSIR